MLDQNTDRMWYVIGAVLIGAAIIFGMNTLMPSAFASVGDNFNILMDKAIPQERTLVGSWAGEVEGGRSLNSDGSVSIGWREEFMRHADLAPIFEEHGLDNQYELVFDIKSKDTSNRDIIQVYNQSGSGARYSFGYHSVKVSEEYQTYTLSYLNVRGANGTYNTSHLAFYGLYSTGNAPVVKNVKLYLIEDR